MSDKSLKMRHKNLIDNVDIKMHEYLNGKINETSILRFVSAYFTIYGFDTIKEKLKQSRQVRFLYGDPQSVESLDPENTTPKVFNMTKEYALELKNSLQQKSLAKECSEWVSENKVAIRSVKSNFLHGKLYSISNADEHHSVVGSSNLTKNGLGAGRGSNVEINLVTGGEQCSEIEEWFDKLWVDQDKTSCVKEQVLANLAKLYDDYTPEFVYYKTLYEIFKDRLAAYESSQEEYTRTKFNETKIYNKLYAFQKDAVASLIYKLEKHNGCILADSVGLGKTFTALGVIKYYERKNKDVLVLCPKKLRENWTVYADTSNINNQFRDDKFSYKVLNHTDLSRVDAYGNPMGMSGDINLRNFNWSAFDLVVIDESHNFRNSTPGSDDKETGVRKKSRYERLLEDIIKDGSHTKVMMLSATPINNSSRDLRNQLYLMSHKNQDHFKDTLGIPDLEEFFRQKEIIFNDWLNDRSKSKNKDKDELYERLGGDFFDLIADVTLARSREQIAKLYKDDMDEIGAFPKRKPLINEYPHTDTEENINYKELYDRITDLNLAIYNPTEYLMPDSKLRKELEESGKFKQTDREVALIGMMRTNFLKRLESSSKAFSITLKKIIDRSGQILRILENHKQGGSNTIGMHGEDEYTDIEDEDFILSKQIKYDLKEMKAEWGHLIAKDKDILEKIYDDVEEVIRGNRDAKLKQLKEDISNKLNNPTTNTFEEECNKVLIFTAFSDTAEYLYEKISKDANYRNVHIALITGSDYKSSQGHTDMNEILNHFAPRGRAASGHCQEDTIKKETEVDVLIATDCISEGQNLPDCDWVINYDIHWNPARLLQRFGRIDRLGSPHSEIQLVNYWPTSDLDVYLDLNNRVEGKMALVDASSTLDNNILEKEDTDKIEEDLAKEISRVDEQLKKMHNGEIDLIEEDDVSLLDFSLDNFIALLWQYITKNKDKLEKASNGLYAVTDNSADKNQDSEEKTIGPGIIFCVKQITKEERKDKQTAGMRKNLVYPYYLVYISHTGEAIYKHTNIQGVLYAFDKLANGKDDVNKALCRLFDQETNDGKDMQGIEKTLEAAVNSIKDVYRDSEVLSLFTDKNPKVTMKQDINFELISWLYVYPKGI